MRSDGNEPNDLRDVQPTSLRHIIGQKHVSEALRVRRAGLDYQGWRYVAEQVYCECPSVEGSS